VPVRFRLWAPAFIAQTFKAGNPAFDLIALALLSIVPPVVPLLALQVYSKKQLEISYWKQKA
jgi:hypothetical protein